MTLLWPWMLPVLLLVPLLVAGYRRQLRRRDGRRRQLAALGLIAGPAPTARGWRRHGAPVLFLTALGLLCLALARPQLTFGDRQREGTVVLAFDISASMAADDLAPTRMAAAQEAAKAFVREQPNTIRIGVVTFTDSALITQQPTDDRAAVVAAIDRLTPQGGTSLGAGLQTALSAIVGRTVQLDDDAAGIDGLLEAPGPDLGYFGSAAVIMLSDGENTSGPDPAQAAELVSTAGVKVYPIGLGSPAGSVLELDGYQVATALDEATLRQIAATTNGRYYSAADSAALAQVYRSIDLAWVVTQRPLEVTAGLAAAAALLVLLGAGLSLRWFGRVI